jgi:hypothetical protein
VGKQKAAYLIWESKWKLPGRASWSDSAVLLTVVKDVEELESDADTATSIISRVTT